MSTDKPNPPSLDQWAEAQPFIAYKRPPPACPPIPTSVRDSGAGECRGKRKREVNWDFVGFFVMLFMALGCGIYLTVQEKSHPCLEYTKRETVCGSKTRCAATDQYGCITWTTEPGHPCTETTCVKRKE